MKTVIAMEVTRPVGVHDLNGFISGISERVPGAFVSQGPGARGKITITILAPNAVPLEVAEQVLELLPELCDTISGIALQEPPRRRFPAGPPPVAAAPVGAQG